MIFSIDNGAMHPDFRDHLLLLDRDTELAIFQRRLKVLTATLLFQIYPTHVHGLIFGKMDF